MRHVVGRVPFAPGTPRACSRKLARTVALGTVLAGLLAALGPVRAQPAGAPASPAVAPAGAPGAPPAGAAPAAAPPLGRCTPPPVPSHGPLLFTNVRVYDGRSDRLSAPSAVLVRGNRIERITPAAAPPVAPDALVIDGRGGTLMPGMIDTHVHLAIPMFPPRIADTDRGYVDALALDGACRMLLRGFTSVRDMGGPTMGLRQAIDEGVALGPRIYPSGAVLTQTGGHADPRSALDVPTEFGGNTHPMERAGWSNRADGVPTVLVAAREQFRLGATQLKIMAGGGVGSPRTPLDAIQFREDEMRAAVDAARDRGTYVAAHVYVPDGIRRALDAGVMSIEHGHLIDEPTMRLLVQKGAYLSTQAFIFFSDRGIVAPEQQPKLRQARDGAYRMFALAKQLRANVTFSTDMAGPLPWQAQQNRELTARLRWFTPAEILRQATSTGAALLALSGPRSPYEGRLGVVEPGALADLLLVAGDPLADLSLLERPAETLTAIVKDGRLVVAPRGLASALPPAPPAMPRPAASAPPPTDPPSTPPPAT